MKVIHNQLYLEAYMTNIFNVSTNTTKLSTLLFSAAFSIIAAASADASRNLKEDDTQYTTPRGKSYLKTDKKVSLRSGSKSAWQAEGASRKRKASALTSSPNMDAGISEDAPLAQPPAKRVCNEETRNQDETPLHVLPLTIENEILPTDEEAEESKSTALRLQGYDNHLRIVPDEIMEVAFEEENTPVFQAAPTHFVAEDIENETLAPIYDFGVDSFTQTAKRTFGKYATKRNLKIAGGLAGVVGGLALADYYFTGGIATTTVASIAPSIAQNVTSVAYNASHMCPAPSFMPSFAQTVVPEVVSQATGFVPSFAQTIVPSLVNTTVTPSFGPLLSGYVAPVVETMVPEVVSTGLVPYVAPYTPSFISPVVETLAPIMTNNASFVPSFSPTFVETVAPVVTTVAPEATRSIFWGFSNMVFGPHQ